MGDPGVLSRFSDVMGSFDSAMSSLSISDSDVSLAGSKMSNDNSITSQNISNNMFLVPSRKASYGSATDPTGSVSSHSRRSLDNRSSYSNIKLSQSRTSSKVDDDSSAVDLTPSSLMSSSVMRWNPYMTFIPESGSDRADMDLSDLIHKPGVLRTLRRNLHTMTGTLESTKYRESAMRLEVRMSELLSGDRPWNNWDRSYASDPGDIIKRTGSAVDPRKADRSKSTSAASEVEKRLSQMSGSSLIERRNSLLPSNVSALSDIEQLSRRLSSSTDMISTGSFVQSQIHVMNSVLESVKETGTSVDPAKLGSQDTQVAALYDSLNIEKLRLQTINSLLQSSQSNPDLPLGLLPPRSSPSSMSSPRFRRYDADSLSQGESLANLPAPRYSSSTRFSRFSSRAPSRSRISLSRRSGRDVSMNKNVTSSTSLVDAWSDDSYSQHSDRTSRRKAPKTKSKSSSNLAQPGGQEVRRSSSSKVIAKVKNPRVRRNHGDGKSLNKSQNWNREPAGPGPDATRSVGRQPGNLSVLEYPGLNYQPSTVFGQWNFFNWKNQNPLTENRQFSEQSNEQNMKQKDVNQSKSATPGPAQQKSADVNSTNSIETRKFPKKIIIPYQPQISLEKKSEPTEKSDVEDCSETTTASKIESDTSDQSKSESKEKSSKTILNFPQRSTTSKTNQIAPQKKVTAKVKKLKKTVKKSSQSNISKPKNTTNLTDKKTPRLIKESH